MLGQVSLLNEDANDDDDSDDEDRERLKGKIIEGLKMKNEFLKK